MISSGFSFVNLYLYSLYFSLCLFYTIILSMIFRHLLKVDLFSDYYLVSVISSPIILTSPFSFSLSSSTTVFLANPSSYILSNLCFLQCSMYELNIIDWLTSPDKFRINGFWVLTPLVLITFGLVCKPTSE